MNRLKLRKRFGLLGEWPSGPVGLCGVAECKGLLSSPPWCLLSRRSAYEVMARSKGMIHSLNYLFKLLNLGGKRICAHFLQQYTDEICIYVSHFISRLKFLIFQQIFSYKCFPITDIRPTFYCGDYEALDHIGFRIEEEQKGQTFSKGYRTAVAL